MSPFKSINFKAQPIFLPPDQEVMKKLMTFHRPGLIFKAGLLFIVLFFPGVIFSQSQSGKVFSSETKSGIGYVNIGIIGKNCGTVSDMSGNFTIKLDNIYDNDSLRFSIIGYKSKSFLAGQFKKDSIKNVYLSPRSYELQEVKVTYHKLRLIRLGNEVTSNDLRSGFANNDLGSELGIMINVRNHVKLKDINLNVAICTFDSVTYRLNIYQLVNKTEYKNILTEPIYISFTKEKIYDVLTFDLWKYSIEIEGDVLISLELYKDLGEGRLLFHTEYFTGTTYHKKTSEGNWTKSPGVIGIYLNGQVIK